MSKFDANEVEQRFYFIVSLVVTLTDFEVEQRFYFIVSLVVTLTEFFVELSFFTKQFFT